MQTLTSYSWSLRKIFVFFFANINISLWLSLMTFNRSIWMVAGLYVLGVIVIVFSNMNKR
ncbi:hypothetical protein QUG02_06465 [Bacillus hominis]|uniref:Uncharacterized protein n=1 Tax=Bacillus hominis TaxID=2817478 RepID=A0ABT7R4B7_9BACI|nr:hypothetical protein [Bacillus hominis]MDM5192616.1 hypothetical protein [Bacillus hominis]MDM5432342.1 hypothetical protein [Bacillus hominis]MDM5437781.1 hypothetical protein [Bacillus hominis]